jgi:hypothetical protein
MRARHLLVALVFLAVALGFLAERARREDTSASFRFEPLTAPAFGPVELPLGTETLQGFVLEQDGRPARDVQVFLYRAEPLAEGAEPLSWTLTDAEGRFELASLAPAAYAAALVRSGHPPATFAVAVPASDPVRWTLPPALEPLRALPEIERAPLTGRIEMLAERGPDSLAGYEVVCLPAADSPTPLSGAVLRRVASDASGAFRVEGLVRGPYVVEVLPPWASGGSWPALARAELDHTGDGTTELVLSMETGAIAGAIVDQAGHAVEGALVAIASAGDPDRIWPAVQTDAVGAFAVLDLPAGHYQFRVRAGAASHERVVEVRAGAVTELEIEPLDLEESLEPRAP